ncbi:uncharacterized protein LOC120281907 isoform X2 [Dioscorea cayenensis subsp. rotundata]|nr:uncharacterized protein LOC120281907 isoform X2 [Dioscorea cayenensis subsp. rotundata]XP_039144536.1 uncharacterized protein LOC120281907 isoform X2 [Dioscorea cayenensis subsp. rotundata]
MDSSESKEKFSRAQREHVKEVLNNIKMQNESSQHTAEILALQENLKRKQDELFAAKEQLSKFKSDGKYVMTSIHEGSAREHMLQQTLDQLQARKKILLENLKTSVEGSTSQQNENLNMFLSKNQADGSQGSSSNSQEEMLKGQATTPAQTENDISANNPDNNEHFSS